MAQQQVVHVLLSPKAPTAQVLVEQIDFAAGAQPPLDSLAAVPVEDVEYLIPKRADGVLQAIQHDGVGLSEDRILT